MDVSDTDFLASVDDFLRHRKVPDSSLVFRSDSEFGKSVQVLAEKIRSRLRVIVANDGGVISR